MNTTVPASTSVSTDRGRRLRVHGLVAVAAIGPLATGAVQLALPYSAAATPADVAGGASAHPAAMNIVLWLDLLIAVTLPLAAVIVSIVAIRAAPLWGTLGAVLTVAGFGAMTTSVLAPDLLAQAANQAGVDPATTARVLDAFGAHPSGQLAIGLFLAGSVLGPILLGVALWKGRAVPVWAAVALIVSGPLHIIFVAVVPSAVAAAAAWLLIGIGVTAAARTTKDGHDPVGS